MDQKQSAKLEDLPDMLEELRLLQEAATHVMEGPLPLVGPTFHDLARYTIAALLGKLIKSAQAIRLTANAGLGTDALSLARTVFETAVVLEWMFEGVPGERAQAYEYYVIGTHRKMLRQWEASPGLRTEVPAGKVNELDATLAKLASELPAGMDPEKLEKHWSGLGSLFSAVEALKGRDLYETFYRFASSPSHGSDAMFHLELGEGEAIELKLYPEHDMACVIAVGVALTFIWASFSKLADRDEQIRAALDNVKPAHILPER